ncbi:MAG: cytochrome C [Deltaproteobacteria bacterium]|nr:cytochrome C [Candidatus Anaeroferrophillus wilburensis]MBN2887998.1 cytochrome C [Deltaproteobacteria bacterium]
MKKLTCAIACMALLMLGFTGTGFAFHGGGVAHCDGCHTMHNSADNPAEGAANSMLLTGSDASSTCLNCHAGGGGYHVMSTDGSNTNAGGDFYWVNNAYTLTVRGTVNTYAGDNAGHNMVAADYGMTADARADNLQAPGGTYAANLLGCTSCHDAHGQVNGGTSNGTAPISASGSYGAAEPTDGSILGNYRLLGDSQYTAGNTDADGFAFNADAPIARASGSNGASVDYGSNMSEWCANCHGDFLVGGSAAHKHPAGNDVHLNGYGTNYNSYVATGDFTGLQATSYDALVPFERGVVTGTWDLDPTSTAGPDNNSNVSCLTCHRAHSSAFNNMGRWDFEVEMLAESHVLESADVPATAVPYYADGAAIDIVTKYGEYQRSLCNKCHVQD